MASRVEHFHRTTDDNSSKLLDQLQNDLKNLGLESRKRHPQIKEACEECIVKLRTALLNHQVPLYNMTNQILYPIVQGCESKDKKIVALCIGVIQKLIIQQAVDQKGSRFITDALWTLTDNGTEEVKVLQTVTLLLTTNGIVRGDTLAKNLVLCFRLNFGKQSTIVNAAGATVRQLVSLIFERAVTEDEQNPGNGKTEINIDELKVPSSHPPSSLRPSAADAYLMFQDLVQLVNADQPYWLNGLSEMTRTFGLELMESVLVKFSSLFFSHPEFKFLLKERVCALVIKLFSPNLKYRNHGQSIHQAATFDKPYFPISIRLLRVVNTLIQQYHSILVTECEIFLSLIVKFVEADKPTWQRTVALEVLHKLSVQPDLLMAFCECYDLRVHSTNVFQDIVNCFGGFVQSQFDNPPLSSSGTNGPHGQGNSSGSGPSVSAQPGFHLRGIWLPITTAFQPGQPKAQLLEMMDKVEPPVIADGYGVSIAYASLQDIVRSIAGIMEKLKVSKEASPPTKEESDDVDTNGESTNHLKLQRQLINSSWFGILMALTPLIDASTDENVTENMLKTMEIYASLAGRVNESSARDAFITAICRAALPTSYNLPILNASAPTFGYSSHEALSLQYSIYGSGEIDYKQQVVAVGTAMPSPTSASSSSAVMLTAKNLQCMKALLILSHSYGTMLGSAWLLVLTTLQHLVWILGLKPTTGGSLKAGRSTMDSNAVITTAVMADLPVLSSMLSRLFESSRNLEPESLNQLIDALCLLSNEAMEVAYNNREPSLFAVAKLLETGLVNLERVEIVWRPLTNHLLDVCQHPHIRMREWGVEAITYLVKSALQYKFQAPLKENQKLQTLLLSPLVELSIIPYCDVRQRQVECILSILHSTGEILTHGWPLMLSIVGAIDENHGENLIRIAFQCLQLIVTDFLPLMPWRCMPLCLETTARFGSQSQELNISLTAIGLMWNVADYFFHNREKLCEALSADGSIFPDCPFSSDLPPFDKLWMCLFTRLSELCVDVRPAVRKSAGQTLFSTISAHGSLLSTNTWQAVLWQVLFPLLDKVRNKSSSASTKKVDAGGSVLIHHSRNTAQKQWAETQVLTLSGVARVFNTKRQLLLTLGNFPKAWSLLLEFVENSALSYNDEVSLAALRAFQEILYVSENAEKNDETDLDEGKYSEVNKEIWEVTWDVWLRIALESLRRNNSSTINIDIDYCPSQPFLASLLHIFPSVFQHIRSRFSSCDMEKLCHVLESAAAVPIFGEGSSHFVSPDGSLSQLQEAVLNCIEKLRINALGSEESMQISICAVFKQLISFCKYAYEIPHFMRKHLEQKEATVINYVPFGERSITMLVNLYRESASQKPVIQGEVLKLILEALDIPLTKRYDKTNFGTWKLTVASFMTVLSIGIPLARKCPEDFESMWPVLASSLDHLLFPKTSPPFDRKERPIEQVMEDEAIDCQVIYFIKEEILSHSKCIPKDFMLKIVVLLNNGSILTTNNVPIRRGYEPNLREEFAKECFETLLEFSLLDGLDENKPEQERLVTKDTDGELAGRLAVTALIFRFQEVLEKHVQDESRSGKCPLPRHRLSEISFVLKAIAILVQSLKTNPQKVNRSVWDQLILLYPFLVNCTVTSYTQISDLVRDALHQFSDLLTPPNVNTTTTAAVSASTVYGNLKATLEDAISSSSAT